MKIYQIDSSARKEGSTSRALAKKLLDKIKKPGDEVVYRDQSIYQQKISQIVLLEAQKTINFLLQVLQKA